MGWEQLRGWFDFQDLYSQAVEEASASEPSVFVEIGVGFGRSLAYLARKIIDSKKPITLYGVDPWIDDWNADWERKGEDARPTWGAEHADWARSQGGPFNAFLAGMREHAREELEFVRIVRERSRDAAFFFPHAGVDFCFVDGSHRYEDVHRDIVLFRERVRAGGVLAGHDHTASFPGVTRAVAELLPSAKVRGASWWVRR
jgi:hypothetical protein